MVPFRPEASAVFATPLLPLFVLKTLASIACICELVSTACPTALTVGVNQWILQPAYPRRINASEHIFSLSDAAACGFAPRLDHRDVPTRVVAVPERSGTTERRDRSSTARFRSRLQASRG